MSYSGVKLLAEERPALLPLVVSAHNIVIEHGNQFTARSVFARGPGGIARSLRPLSLRGIVDKMGSSKKGHRVFYRLVDPPGVERALRDLGLL